MFARYIVSSEESGNTLNWFVTERHQEADNQELHRLESDEDNQIAAMYPDERAEGVIMLRQQMRRMVDELFTHSEAVQLSDLLRRNEKTTRLELVPFADVPNADTLNGHPRSDWMTFFEVEIIDGRASLEGYDLPFEIRAYGPKSNFTRFRPDFNK